MIDVQDGIGTPGTRALQLDVEEQRLMSSAVRESVRRQILSLLRRRGIDPTTAIACSACREHVIHLDQPATFVFDRRLRDYLCRACGAERDFAHMTRPDADIGGEGG